MEPIVTLTTDWGDHDFFLGAVKGSLYSSIPMVRVVDLSHSQVWNDIAAVANMVRYACLSFPVGSIHLIDVGSNDDKKKCQDAVATCYRGHYFICSDVDILEQALDEDCEMVYRLVLPETVSFGTFRALSVFCPAAVRLLQGEGLDHIGVPLPEIRLRGYFKPSVDKDMLLATVTMIDKYGNAMLNVTYDEFCRIRASRKFCVEVGGYHADNMVSTVSRHYGDVHRGALLLTVSATGFLQLAINKGSVSQLLGVKFGCGCNFRFY